MIEITILSKDDEKDLELRDRIIAFVNEQFAGEAIIIPGVTKRPKP